MVACTGNGTCGMEMSSTHTHPDRESINEMNRKSLPNTMVIKTGKVHHFLNLQYK